MLSPIRACAPAAIKALAAATAVAAVFTLAACGSDKSAPQPISLHAKAGPAGTTFWDVQDKPAPDAKPGDIYWIQPRTDAPADTQGWNVVYVSEIQPGVKKFVSGEIYAPTAHSDQPRDMVLWNHETTGLADACAPSRRSLSDGEHSRVPAIEAMLKAGHVVAMSDYPGQGLPGPSYYMVGAVNARASLDMLRAVHNLPELNASNRFVEYGWSQGGQTTMRVESLARSYAPEFQGVGAALIAPAVRIRDLTLHSMSGPDNAGYVISTLPGIKAAYPDLLYRDFLKPDAMEMLPVLANGCFDIWDAAAPLRDAYQPNALSPGSTWWNAMSAVDDWQPAGTMPFAVYQGVDDTVVPKDLTQRERTALCHSGVAVDYNEFTGQDHETVVPSAADRFPAWAADRFAGKPAPTNCPA
ncbi:lipase family protein [Nocardia sp. NPDC046763]|uniref:lipase family protein n=1 Tax=Nocardia sp. NPDC046763 TaxID=3155256 RepID=UPI0033DB1C3B